MSAGPLPCDLDTPLSEEGPFWVTMPLPAPDDRHSIEVCYRLKRGSAGRCAKYWLQLDKKDRFIPAATTLNATSLCDSHLIAGINARASSGL
jgi:hypothetical protein